MYSVEEFSSLPLGIFRIGICSNSPTGAFMTREGGHLKFVAVKWDDSSWGIYIGRTWDDEESIRDGGDFLSNRDYAKNLLPCSNEIMAFYNNP